MDSRLKSFPITERALSLLTPKCVAAAATASRVQKAPAMSWISRLHTAWNTWQTHTLALADQGIVSGASFLTTVLIARWTLPSELGLYSIGISLLISSLAIQESLISLPYTIQQGQPIGTRAEHAGSALALCGLMSALAIVVVAVTALGLSAGSAVPELVAVTWALVGVVPFALLREFGRRFAFAHLHVTQALILDLAVATMQLGALSWLGWTGRMSAVTALAAIGAACALTGIGWLYLVRGSFTIRVGQLREPLKQSWSLGKWLFATQLTLLVKGYITFWLLAWIDGTTATGVYTACMTIVLFSNPLTMGLCNILTPRAALALTEGGGARLRRESIRDSLLLGAAMTLFCAAVLLAGEDVMRLLYHGKEYAGHGHTITVLALALLASAVGMPATSALTSIGRPDAIFCAGLFAVIVTVVLVWCLVVQWGLVGAAYGFLAGNVAGAALRWVALLALVPRRSPEANPMSSDPISAMAIRALEQFTRNSNDGGWIIEKLDQGVQANIFVVRSKTQQPIWQTYRSLVIKVYKPAAATNIERVREQFDSLSRLHAAMDGSTINGWKISAPAPLYLCESPLALVMPMVSGQKLTLLLETNDNVAPELLETAARAVGITMARCWSIGLLHGDLCVDNILCDIVTRDLSFVDLGVPDNSFFCDDIAKRWYPASRDLAYMLYATAVRVKSTIGNPGACLLQQVFAENVVRTCIEMIGPFEEKQWLLDEIHACARAHLKSVDLSLSPRGLWHVLLRRVASRRIDRLLARLRTDSGVPSDGHDAHVF